MITAFITRLPFKPKKKYKYNDIQQRYSNDKNDVERSERIKSTYKVNYNVTERTFLFPIYFDAIIFFSRTSYLYRAKLVLPTIMLCTIKWNVCVCSPLKQISLSNIYSNN